MSIRRVNFGERQHSERVLIANTSEARCTAPRPVPALPAVE